VSVSRYIKPPPFHTFDPIREDPSELIPAIREAINGSNAELIGIIGDKHEIIEHLQSGNDIDPATMLFLSLIDWQKGGNAPAPLDTGHSRERLGRFPTEDGNAIEYILSYTKVSNDGDLHSLLSKLSRGLMGGESGEEGFSIGTAGMEILGWLDNGNISDLRKEIESGKWSVKSTEPFDGGVQDAFRHLLTILRAAERRDCGLLMRRHN